jgi:putative phosphoribosyl transferase
MIFVARALPNTGKEKKPAREGRRIVKFIDRSDAGRQLAGRFKDYSRKPRVLILALSPGSVPVAAEIALALNAPLDIFLVRNLCVPGQEKLVMGTITTGGTRVLNDDVVNYLGISEETVDAVVRQERRELERRERPFRDERPAPEIEGKTVILVDDGMANGSMMKAALTALCRQRPARLIVALPVIARTTREAIELLTDEIVCVGAQLPEPLFPDGIWYEDFRQPTEAEAGKMLSDLQHC